MKASTKRRALKILESIRNYHSIQRVGPDETDPSRLFPGFPHSDEEHERTNGHDAQCEVITLCKELERLLDDERE